MLQDFRLKVFLKVASLKSFTKAAEALDVSQPAVSQNVSELEKGLGVRLFQRMRGETVLTPEGEVFAGYARRILAVSAEAELMFSQLDVSEVRIGVTDDVLMAVVCKALKNFVAVHPEVPVVFTSSGQETHIDVTAVPSADSNDAISFQLVYKPTQAFAITKTCAVLKNILGF